MGVESTWLGQVHFSTKPRWFCLCRGSLLPLVSFGFSLVSQTSFHALSHKDSRLLMQWKVSLGSKSLSIQAASEKKALPSTRPKKWCFLWVRVFMGLTFACVKSLSQIGSGSRAFTYHALERLDTEKETPPFQPVRLACLSTKYPQTLSSCLASSI